LVCVFLARAQGGSVSDRLRGEAAARGVHPARLVFAPKAGRLAYFKRLAAVDLFLDSRP
jgi:predicted O-linked N-acetylglucosamine transferase (SPINDLY family)